MVKRDIEKNGLRRSLLGEGSVSVRFRNANIALFILAFVLMSVAMLSAFDRIFKQASVDHAQYYAASAASVFSSHIVKEIGYMAQAARSGVVLGWLSEEDNKSKRALAFGELRGITEGIDGDSLFVVVDKARQGYKVEGDSRFGGNRTLVTLDPDNPDDDWYFRCIAAENKYLLSVDFDHDLQMKRVWLDYRVIRGGFPLGVISAELNFASVAQELFSKYDSTSMRGLIVDENGVIYIDSFLLSEEDSLLTIYNYNARIEDEFSDPAFLAAIRAHFDSIDGYFEAVSDPVAVKLSSGKFNYATIAPIRYTNWSAIILHDSSSSFDISLFVPVSVVVLALLIAFSVTLNAISRRLIFKPFGYLLRSLAKLKENQEAVIYGIERDDEIGDLSKTIHDLFTKANNDALTGIYNRRYMEDNLRRLMDFLSRSNGLLSVLMVDVDYFKYYNDTYGHEQGDVSLKLIARAVTESITRVDDFAARYGGEEFVVVLPNTDRVGACLITEKLLENVRRLNIPHASSDISDRITVSVGVTTGRVSHLQNWEEYLKRADEAMYMSKQSGRNKYTYVDFE